MTTSIVRADPKVIPTSLKEAVVDSLLNIVHARISGAFEFGEVLYGTRPRNLLNSAFLLPMRGQEEGDEVTSPIWVSSHGLDFQIARTGDEQLVVKPRFNIYVRILPNEEDLKREDCKPSFRLKSEVAKHLNEKIRKALEEKWEQVKGSYKSRQEHPEWLKIKEEVRVKVYVDDGVPTDLTRIGYSEDEESEEEGGDKSGSTANGVVVTPGKPIKVKDEQFEPLRIPHKWLRLDLDVAPLIYSLYEDGAIRADQIAKHEAAMRDVIKKRLETWMASDDRQTGGKLWAFRKDEEIRPSQYYDWKKFLEDVRKRGNPPVLPDIEPKWDIVVSPIGWTQHA